MQRKKESGLSANKPISTDLFLNSVLPRTIQPRKPLTTDENPTQPIYRDVRNMARDHSLAPKRPLSSTPLEPQFQPMMQQAAVAGLAPRRPMNTMETPPNQFNVPVMQQPAPPSLAPRRPINTMETPPNLQFNVPVMQQPALLGLAPRRPMNTMEISEEQTSLGSGLDPHRPKITQLEALSRINARIPLSTGRVQKQERESRIVPRKPLNQDVDLMQVEEFLDMQESTFEKVKVLDETSPVIAETDILYKQVPSLRDNLEDFMIDRPGQIQNIQQSRYASSIPEVEPTDLSKMMEIEEFFTTKIPYNPRESIRPTNEIENEIEKLTELYNNGYIPHAVYEHRLSELTVAKKYSSVNIVPHVDHGFTNQRRSSISTSKNRNVRVFVSSTFRDMGDEREILLKQVIPKLREFCKSRGVFLTAVDLRWGITSQETERGDTISICLKEVDRCRPYFLCLLGYRYGWAQPLDIREPRDSLLTKTFNNAATEFPWVNKYSDRSVTELEIRHAVLNNTQTDTAHRALFYLKSESGAKDDDIRLTKLKEELDLNADLKTQKYKKPENLEEIVYKQICDIFSEDFPMNDIPTPLEREKMAHDAFQESRARVYIGRQYYFDTINAHLAKPNSGPIVIIGNSGSGKSALVCNWAVQYRDSHPADLVITHYIGSTSASTDLGRMLQRILQEINEFYSLGKDIPTDFKELSESFPKWLAEASRRGGVVLVLDALNQLDPHRYNALDLAWLPKVFPSEVKLVVSTLPGRTQEVLSQRGWTTLTVQPLTAAERLTLVQEYLALFGKKLTEQQLDIIVNAPQCENPLFLRTLLEEIRVFGVYEKLGERISHYLSARTPPELFELVFKRLEGDFEKDRPSLVGDILASIWVSRRGLLESELVEILNLSHNVWSPLYLAISEAVVSKSGFLTFFHDYMRQAVEARYLKRQNTYKKYRELLVNYFLSEKCKDKQRKYEEAPYLLENDQQWKLLCDFISNYENFSALFEKEHKFDLYRYWRSVSSNNYTPDTLLIKSINESEISDKIQAWSRAGTFLQELGAYEQAENCAKQAISLVEKIVPRDEKNLCRRWQDLAYILRLKGRYAEAAPLYEKSLQIYESLPNPNPQELAQNINSLAILYRMQGKYDKAEPLYLKALNIRRELFGEVHEDIAQSMNSLGCLNQDMGRYAIAENFFFQAISQREQLLGSNHPDVAMSLNNLGGLYLDWSKYSQAEPIYIRAKQIYQTVFGDVHPYVAKSLNSLAGLYQEQGKYALAEDMYKKCIEMKRKLLGNLHPELALTLNDFAVLYARQDKYPEAEVLYSEALNIRDQVLGKRHPDYAQSLKNMASLYQDMRKYQKALPLFLEALNICIEVFGNKHQDVASAYITLAGCYQMMAQYNEAVPYYEKALHILQELLGPNHADVALALNDMAVLYFRKKDFTKAEDLYLRALKTYENVFGLEHPHTGEAVLNIAQFYHSIGNMEKAPKFYKQALQIFTSQHGPDHPKTIKVKNEFALFSN